MILILPIVLTVSIVLIFTIRSSMMTGLLDIIHSIPVITGDTIPISLMDGVGDILITTIIHPLHGGLADTWVMAFIIPIITDTMTDTMEVIMATEVVTMTLMT